MPQNLLAIHGVLGLVCAVGEGGKILMFRGDIYQSIETESPTTADLRGVWVTSPEDAWAVGDGVILRWNGRAWSKVLPHAKPEGFGAIWGDPTDGSVWFGSKHSLLRYRTDGGGGTLVHTELAIRAIWGTGSDDVFYLCDQRSLMHWRGNYINGDVLPGDPDEEWNAVAGNDERVFIVGPSGFLMEWVRAKGWFELSSDTTAILTGLAASTTISTWSATRGRFDAGTGAAGARWHSLPSVRCARAAPSMTSCGPAGIVAWSSNISPATAGARSRPWT